MGKRIEGIKNNGTDIAASLTKRVFRIGSKEAKRRLLVCKDCENKEEDDVFGGYMCGLCFCPLKNLVYSSKGCDANKW